MEEDLVSIIIPVYNVAEYLAECLDSVLRQTYTKLQIVLVDDGSTDDSCSICEEYQSRDERILLVRKENGGPASARNAGLEVISGQWVGFIDSDDIVEHDYVEKMMQCIKKEEADIVLCGFERYDSDTGEIYSREMLKGSWMVLEASDLGEILYVNPGVWNKIYKAELFLHIRFTELRIAEELALTVEMLKEMPRITRVREVLYHYRVRGESLMNTVNQNVYNELLYALREKRKQIGMSDKEMLLLYDAMIFVHVGISMTSRLIQGDNTKKRIYIREAKEELDREFPYWRKTRYLSLASGMKRGIKGIGLWGCRLLYKMNLFILFINFYQFVQNKLHKDIKW